jgi:Spy/CpxP family protein refolding chaperone
MRTLAMAAAVLALVAMPAHAQMGGGGGKRGHKADDPAKTDDQKAKAKATDKAYQEALKRIPDSKEKFDPWAVAKPADADKKPSK